MVIGNYQLGAICKSNKFVFFALIPAFGKTARQTEAHSCFLAHPDPAIRSNLRTSQAGVAAPMGVTGAGEHSPNPYPPGIDPAGPFLWL